MIACDNNMIFEPTVPTPKEKETTILVESDDKDIRHGTVQEIYQTTKAIGDCVQYASLSVSISTKPLSVVDGSSASSFSSSSTPDDDRSRPHRRGGQMRYSATPTTKFLLMGPCCRLSSTDVGRLLPST